MSLHPRILRVTMGIVGFLPVDTTVEASVVSFKAVKKNDVVLTPGVCNLTTHSCTTGPVGKDCANNDDCPVGTNNLAVVANDVIELEMYLSDWINDFPIDGTPNNVRAFQVKLNRTGFVSNDNGTAKPLGWCGPVDPIACTTDAQCVAANPAYPICLGDNGGEPPTGCTCSPFTPDLGAFIDYFRTDYLFFGPEFPFIEIVQTSLDYTYIGIPESPALAAADTGVPRYLGTLIVKVSANACGTFTIGHIMEINSTFITDPAVEPNVSLPSLQPLVLTVTDCSRQLLSCSPSHCNIDARIAHDRLDQAIRFNTNSMVMTFSKLTQYCSNATSQTCNLDSDCPAGGTCVKMTAADFEVTVVPYESNANCTGAGQPYACCTGVGTGNCDILPVINAITATPADRRITTIHLNRRIQQMRWTCIRDKGSNKRCCMGSLPPDANNSRASQINDVFKLWDNLEGLVIPALPIEKCDIDRSARCSGADLLMAVDVLNGADEFIETNGDSLPALVPACPTMNMPP